jgi:hypothetical protein
LIQAKKLQSIAVPLMLSLMICLFCQHTINNTDHEFFIKGVEGTWKGYLAQDSLFLTFIEGRFENSPTLSGSATISSDSISRNCIIMSGTFPGNDSLLFSLYTFPLRGKESFFCRGQLRHDTLSGAFTYYDSSGLQLGKGSWWSKRIP